MCILFSIDAFMAFILTTFYRRREMSRAERWVERPLAHARLSKFIVFLCPGEIGGCLFTELGFRAGFQVGFSSWIFELGFFWRDFFFFGEVSNKFSVVLLNVLCHRLEVFSRWRRTRMADRYGQSCLRYPSIAFVAVFWIANNSWHFKVHGMWILWMLCCGTDVLWTCAFGGQYDINGLKCRKQNSYGGSGD